MNIYNETTIQLLNCGRQDCTDLHSWGPGMRPCYIIHYVIRGSGYLEYNHKKNHIHAGESFLTHPFESIHYYPDPADPWEYVWVDFVGKEVPVLLKETCFQKDRPVFPAFQSGNPLPLFDKLSTLDYFHTNRLEANGLLLTLLGLYGDHSGTAADHSLSSEDQRLSTALLLIHSNYHHTSFHIDNLCETMHLSRPTIYRLFQNALGLSPQTYLVNYRLEQAKQMLQITSSVKNVSVSCGFCDPFYFSKMFKRYTGMPPSQYTALGRR